MTTTPRHTHHSLVSGPAAAVLFSLQLHIDVPNVTIKQSIWDNDICGDSISAGPLFYNVICFTLNVCLTQIPPRPPVLKGIGHERHGKRVKPAAETCQQTNAGRSDEWKRTRACSQKTCGSDHATREQRDAPASLFVSVPSLLLYLLFQLNLSASPGAFFISLSARL